MITLLSPTDHAYPINQCNGWFNPLPVLHYIGNKELVNWPLVALFCSRKCPGDAILKAYDMARELRGKETPVIGGFHTPVEKDMLEILLKGKGPIVICPARGLEGMRLSPSVNRAIAEGRLLLLSMFTEKEKRIIKENCEARNNLVAALAYKVIFIHYDPNGSLSPLYTQLECTEKLG